MFGMNGFHVSARGAIQGHHGPLVFGYAEEWETQLLKTKELEKMFVTSIFTFSEIIFYPFQIRTHQISNI